MEAMNSAILRQLDVYGPDRCKVLTAPEAEEYTRGLVATQYENFTVVSWLLPRALRGHFANVYAFCRWADDLGDETGDKTRSLELLQWWRRELDACYADEPRHPVFVALSGTIKTFDIPRCPFDDLIDAFIQDQKIDRYRTWDQVVDYCTRSADPVGRLVLYMCDHRDDQRQRLSDKTCTALQLVNFWQDVRRDIIERDRIYVPLETLEQHGLTHEHLVNAVIRDQPLTDEQTRAYHGAIRLLVDRTWKLFHEGHALWPLVEGRLRVSIQLFSMGGEAIMRKIERIGYDTLNQRPRLSKWGKAKLMAWALVKTAGASLRGGGGR